MNYRRGLVVLVISIVHAGILPVLLSPYLAAQQNPEGRNPPSNQNAPDSDNEARRKLSDAILEGTFPIN